MSSAPSQPSTAVDAPAALPPLDSIDKILGLQAGEPRHLLRHNREKIAHHTQLSEDALFDGAVEDISVAERLFAAWYAAHLTGIDALAREYETRLVVVATSDDAALTRQAIDSIHRGVDTGLGNARLAAIAEHTRMLNDHPVRARPAHLHALQAAGLTTHAIVVLSQLLAFVAYQARVIAAVHALAPNQTVPSGNRAAIVPDPLDPSTFTFDTLGWKAWLDIVTLDQATPDQIKVLEESHPKAKVSDYYLFLVHAPEILRQRSAVFNAIMYGPGGMSRAEREMGATVVSRVNGCVYCASVHAQRFSQLAKRTDSIEQVYADPATAGVSAREQALSAYSIQLTLAPSALDGRAMQALEAVGMSHEEILDLTHSLAIFAWANRLMLSLGEPVFPEAA